MPTLISLEQFRAGRKDNFHLNNIAFIDCGSRSQKLVIINPITAEVFLQSTKYNYDLVDLIPSGKKLKQWGDSQLDKWRRFKWDMRHLMAHAAAADVSAIYFLPTAAVRQGHETVQEDLEESILASKKDIKNELNKNPYVKFHVLSGSQEAILCALGSLSGLKLKDQTVITANQGGKTCDIADVTNGIIVSAESVTVGRGVLALQKSIPKAAKFSEIKFAEKDTIENLDNRKSCIVDLSGGVLRDLLEVLGVIKNHDITTHIFSVAQFRKYIADAYKLPEKKLVKLREDFKYGIAGCEGLINAVEAKTKISQIVVSDLALVHGAYELVNPKGILAKHPKILSQLGRELPKILKLDASR